MIDNEKREKYIIERRSHALTSSINAILHGIQNIEVFSNHTMWPDNKGNWDSVRNDAETIHVEIVKLKMKLDLLLSQYTEEEKK